MDPVVSFETGMQQMPLAKSEMPHGVVDRDHSGANFRDRLQEPVRVEECVDQRTTASAVVPLGTCDPPTSAVTAQPFERPVARSAATRDTLDWLSPEVREPRQDLLRLIEDVQAGKIDPSHMLTQAKLLHLQMRVQDRALQMETLSKVVEHATSATKTVLQTQA